MEAALQLTQLTQAELGDSTRAVIAALKNFGDEGRNSSRVIALIQGAAVVGIGDVGQLTAAFQTAAESAGVLGVSMSETLALISQVSLRTQDYGQAAQRVREFMDILIKRTERGTKALQRIGRTYGDLQDILVNQGPEAFLRDLGANISAGRFSLVEVFDSENARRLIQQFLDPISGVINEGAISTLRSNIESIRGSVSKLGGLLEEVQNTIGSKLERALVIFTNVIQESRAQVNFLADTFLFLLERSKLIVSVLGGAGLAGALLYSIKLFRGLASVAKVAVAGMSAHFAQLSLAAARAARQSRIISGLMGALFSDDGSMGFSFRRTLTNASMKLRVLQGRLITLARVIRTGLLIAVRSLIATPGGVFVVLAATLAYIIYDFERITNKVKELTGAFSGLYKEQGKVNDFFSTTVPALAYLIDPQADRSLKEQAATVLAFDEAVRKLNDDVRGSGGVGLYLGLIPQDVKILDVFDQIIGRYRSLESIRRNIFSRTLLGDETRTLYNEVLTNAKLMEEIIDAIPTQFPYPLYSVGDDLDVFGLGQLSEFLNPAKTKSQVEATKLLATELEKIAKILATPLEGENNLLHSRGGLFELFKINQQGPEILRALRSQIEAISGDLNRVALAPDISQIERTWRARYQAEVSALRQLTDDTEKQVEYLDTRLNSFRSHLTILLELQKSQGGIFSESDNAALQRDRQLLESLQSQRENLIYDLTQMRERLKILTSPEFILEFDKGLKQLSDTSAQLGRTTAEAIDDTGDMAVEFEYLIDGLTSSFSDFFVNTLSNFDDFGDNLKDQFRSLLGDLSRQLLDFLVGNPIRSFFSSVLSPLGSFLGLPGAPTRHGGGPVTEGGLYQVQPGEAFFKAGSNGRIESNNNPKSPPVINITVNGDNSEATLALFMNAIPEIREQLLNETGYVLQTGRNPLTSRVKALT